MKEPTEKMQGTYSKYFYILAAIVFMNTYVLTETVPGEEKRIDDDGNYVKYQDIYKAFEKSDKYWIYGFNFPSNHSVGRTCIYLKKESLWPEGMNYSSNFCKNGKKGSFHYEGTFYSTKYTNMSRPQQNRTKPNCITATTNQSVPDALPRMDYKLIYSDYNNCSIFRILSARGDAGNGCMVLLTSSVVSSGMPVECRSMFNNSCARYRKLDVIFDEGCKVNVKENACQDSSSAIKT